MDSRTTWALDSGFLSYLDSGFHCLDSGFQDSGFRIPKPTKSRIPDSGLPHKGPYNGRCLALEPKARNYSVKLSLTVSKMSTFVFSMTC
jgi:hypothetical protein